MDILIHNVNLFDQTKRKSYIGGIVIVDSRIIDIFSVEPNLPLERFERVIDGAGKYMLPGFFDVHSRGDLSMVSEPTRMSTVSQGITVEVIGQDGFSVAPVSKKNYMLHGQYVHASLGNPQLNWRWKSVGGYLEALDNRISTNILYYAPHGTLRLESSRDSVLSPAAISAVKYLFEKSLDEGSVGLSISASKKPSSLGWDSVDEMAPLLAILESQDAVLNISLEGVEGVVAEIEKCLAIAKEYGLRLHLSRLCPSNDDEWDASLSLLDKKKKDVKELLVDIPSYTTGMMSFTDMLPDFLKSSSGEEIRVRLRDKSNVANISESLKTYEKAFNGMRLISASDKELSKYNGWLVKNIARERDEDILDTLLNFLVFDIDKIFFEYDLINPRILEKAFALPFIVPATTGFSNNRPVPDMFGAIPKYIIDYSKNDIFQMSNKLATVPAGFFRINWGIKRGKEANMVLTDPANVKTFANLANPRFPAEGIDLVIVNGKIAWENGKVTGTKNGRVLSWI
ncbi:MAG: amidohydrolase family protein [Oligoflexia bacterium]|nr:amidohydrolase family protein [Oligoflexia bacterium]